MNRGAPRLRFEPGRSGPDQRWGRAEGRAAEWGRRGRAIRDSRLVSPYVRLLFNLPLSVPAVKRGFVRDHGTSMRRETDIIGRLLERNSFFGLKEIERDWWLERLDRKARNRERGRAVRFFGDLSPARRPP